MNSLNNIIVREVGAKIKFIRNIRKISSNSLAKKLGISRQQLQKYETGEVDIKIDRLFNIAKIMNVDITYFFENTDSAKTTSQNNGFDILLKFNNIKNSKIREAIYGLVKELSED